MVVITFPKMSLPNYAEMQRLQRLREMIASENERNRTNRIEEPEPKKEFTCFWKWCLLGSCHILCMPCNILIYLYKLIKWVFTELPCIVFILCCNICAMCCLKKIQTPQVVLEEVVIITEPPPYTIDPNTVSAATDAAPPVYDTESNI